jgi:tetratricopeptide (TPR) repeat protein
MLFKWFNAREASEAGVALADDFVLQSVSGSARRPETRGYDLQRFLQKFLQRVDSKARPLQLNVFKRAKLANSFRWRLIEKGVEEPVVDELTRALVLRLTPRPAGAPASEPAEPGAKRRPHGRDSHALHLRATEAFTRGAYPEALECYQELVRLDPRDAVARSGLGTVLAMLCRYQEAEDHLRRAVALRPGYLEAHYNLASVLQSMGMHDDAEEPLRRVLKLKPSHLDARISLGMSFILLGRLGDARECFEKALRVAPRNVRALCGLGQIEALEGRFAEAESRYRSALEIDPGFASALAGLVGLRKMTPADSAWLKSAEEAASGVLTPTDEVNIRFAIGKYYDDTGEFAKAFRSFQRGNELHKMRATPYRHEAHARFVDDLIRVYSREALARVQAGASDSARPVFICGMPRSGTSLVEQIIASHPDAQGAGELNFWAAVLYKHEDGVRRGLIEEPLRRKLAQAYLSVLTAHSPDAARVADKAPINSDYLGLIHSVFPNARFIYMRRDPIDTCLSCYFQQFPPTLNYTMDLDDLGHYYREHHRLVGHWSRVLPAQTLLEVPYADLTADQENWTRRILEFVGLPWNERCLDFHQTVRPVTTASTWQVRQKMYRTSVERWRNYEKFIGPLRSLEDLTA